MAVFELFGAILSFDIGFLIDFALGHIFWVFAFYTAGYFFSDKKNPFFTGVIAVFVIIETVDILYKVIGFSIYTAVGLLLLYLGRITVLTYLQSSKDLAKHIPTAYVLLFFLTLGWIAFWS